jgi:UDP-3-O-[3-hydroxymyristoyl] glucosamine N-acyltransferase
MPALTAAEIARLCNGTLEGDGSYRIAGANTIEQAGPGEIAFASNPKSLDRVAGSRAGCLIVPVDFDGKRELPLVRAADPRAAFARILTVLYSKPRPPASIHPTAIIAETARLAPECTVGPYVTIGENCEIGAGSIIAAGCHIGAHVTIGEESTLHAGVIVYDNVRIGARAILHSGCVIGADGFGFALADDHYEKFPQVGSVEIGNDVELGANTCVDRAALGITRIGDGTKIDNLVHIAHNCFIGKHVVIAAQTGLSGSVTIGDHAVIGGQVGVGEKACIESRAVVGGKAGVLVSQRVRSGEPYWGIPARPLREHLRNLAQLGKIGELRHELREIKKVLRQAQKP